MSLKSITGEEQLAKKSYILLGGGMPAAARIGALFGASSMIALALAAPVVAQTSAAGTASTPPTESNVAPVDNGAATDSTSARKAAAPKDEAVSPGASVANRTSSGQTSAGAEIVVTGLRGSLQRNLDIKRTSSGIVDAISAEDIGKFPDSNVAAALQRLPGISIQRDGARGDPTGVTVRGFGGDFVTTLYDGRRVSSATGGRQIDFSTVGADFVGELDVLKTPDDALSASAIGATINIKFPKPFDHPGFRLAATGAGSIQDAAGKVAPTGGLLLSDTFADDTIGILVDGIYTRHDTQTDRVFVSGWEGGMFAPCQIGVSPAACSPTSDSTSAAWANPANRNSVVGWYQQQYGAERQQIRDERIDGRIALQWHPSESLLFTIDDNFSRQKINTTTAGFGVWFNQGALRNITQDGNGTVTNFTQDGTPFDFQAATNSQILQTNQLGANVKWDVTDHIHVDGDASWSKSYLNPGHNIGSLGGDIGYGGTLGTTLGVAVNGNSDNHIPVISTYGPNGNTSEFLDQDLIGTHVATNQTQRNSDDIKQARLEASYSGDNGLKIRLGGQYVKDVFNLHNENTFFNNFWQAYAGYGAASGSAGGLPIPPGLITGTYSTKNFIPGFSGALPPELPIYSSVAFQNYLQSLGNPYAQNIPGFNYPAPGDTTNGLNNYDGILSAVTDPGSVQHISEQTWSGFLTISQTTELAGMPFHMNFGAREEVTKIVSSGLGTVPLSLTLASNDKTAYVIAFSGTQPVSTKSSYAYFLPSIDLSLDVTNKLKLRFDASRTLTRPPLNKLTPVLTGVGGRVGSLVATGGNPKLKPYLSDNFDVGAEWYYHSNSYFSVDFFAKHVTNFIVTGTQRETINDVIDPATGQPGIFTVQSSLNGPTATVKGVEVALQHVFGNSGFGFNANATFVDTNKPYNANDISQTGFAVTGLANSANFVGFYDKNGFQARVAVNWRDEYLLQFGQNQNNSAFGAEPTFVNASTQVDFSSSYDITKHINVFFEALNLNDAVQSTHGRFKNQLLDVFHYGRRFTLGAHVRF